MPMRAIIKDFESSDVADLRRYRPTDPLVFAVSITFAVGPVDMDGADNFHLTVVTAEFLRRQHPDSPGYFLRHYLLVQEYHFGSIFAAMSKYVNSLEADTWEQLAAKIGRVALWEFEDYRL